jgi:hypothetical protein
MSEAGKAVTQFTKPEEKYHLAIVAAVLDPMVARERPKEAAERAHALVQACASLLLNPSATPPK